MDMYMDNLVSLIEESYQGNNYVFLTTSDGTILVHPNNQYSLDVDRTPTVQTVNSGRYESFTKIICRRDCLWIMKAASNSESAIHPK